MIKKLINYWKYLKYSIMIGYYETLIEEINYKYLNGEINMSCRNLHINTWNRKIDILETKKGALN